MLARYYRLEKYSDESFRDFVRALSDLYKMGQIRISPHQGARLFGAFQRKHLCPGWDIRHPKGFLAVWARHRSVVRTVTFILFRANGSPRVEMTVDLERNILSLDQADGIDPEEVSSVLRWNFNIREVTFLESARMTTLVTLVIAATIVGMVLVFVVLGFFFHWLDSVSAKNSGIQTEPNRSDELVEKTKAVIGTISNIAHGASAFEISLFLLGVLAFSVFVVLLSRGRYSIGKDGGAIPEKPKETNIELPSPVSDAESLQSEVAPELQTVWWKDTLWGVVLIGVLISVCVGFVIYSLGWNK